MGGTASDFFELNGGRPFDISAMCNRIFRILIYFIQRYQTKSTPKLKDNIIYHPIIPENFGQSVRWATKHQFLHSLTEDSRRQKCCYSFTNKWLCISYCKVKVMKLLMVSDIFR
jgi:hypothetical protein